jgi:hypothetical protein
MKCNEGLPWQLSEMFGQIKSKAARQITVLLLAFKGFRKKSLIASATS